MATRWPEALRPDKRRRFSVDMVPQTAYWRMPTVAEKKIDFAAMEEDEGRAMTGSRLRLGLIFAAQMERYIEWVQKDTFSYTSLRRIPLFFADEVGDELARFSARAFFSGTSFYAQAKDRYRASEGVSSGQPDSSPPRIALSARGSRKLLEDARRQAIRMCHGIAYRIAPILESAFDAEGQLKVDKATIEGQIRSFYRTSLIEETQEDLRDLPVLELSALPPDMDTELFYGAWDLARAPHLRGLPPGKRRMKVRDQEQWEEWQRTRVPFRKSIKDIAAKGAGKRRPPQLKAEYARIQLQSERSKYFNHAVMQSAIEDPECASLQFSSLRDSRVCEICQARDGVVRKKGDDWWALNMPPMHLYCRCDAIPVFKFERVKVTPVSQIRQIDDSEIAAGWGQYDPKKVRSAKALGIKVGGPWTQQSRAFREALGRR